MGFPIKHQRSGCEGIVTSEKEEAYEAMLNFQVKYSRRKKENVHAIACDGFLGQSQIERFGFTNSVFIKDYWHLFKQVSETKFHF